jgi:hypothetical protein
MRKLLSLLLVACCGSTLLSAQTSHPQVRQGFWISFGLGAGSYDLACDGCTYDAKTDLAGNFRLGGTVSPNLLVGGETMGWTHSEDGVNQLSSSLMAVVLYYPSAKGGLYLKGGLGIAMYRASDGTDDATMTGFGFSGGIGYDIRLAKNFSLTPYVNAMYGTSASYKFNGTDTGVSASQRLFQAGLAVTFH